MKAERQYLHFLTETAIRGTILSEPDGLKLRVRKEKRILDRNGGPARVMIVENFDSIVTPPKNLINRNLQRFQEVLAFIDSHNPCEAVTLEPYRAPLTPEVVALAIRYGYQQAPLNQEAWFKWKERYQNDALSA